ncbi:MAG TPA: D-alanyl-D-alanine carboxypeptidase family protein [Pyrinomonadaceae bacterium]
MTGQKVLLPVALSCAALCALALALAWPGYSQGRRTARPASSGAVKKTSAPAAPAADAGWAAAGRQNAQLRTDLSWVFGGKEQRGWGIYVPLIAHTLDTEAAADSAEFAQALARWQRGAGLAPSGVLFGDTLYKLVADWQAHRLKARAYPTADQLLVAPATDFYDASRPDDQRQVEKETYAAYKRMVAAAAADRVLGEKYLKIVSAFRSRERQEELRRKEPQSGRAGLAVNSPHFTGRALDLYVGGDPVSTKDANRALQTQTPAYRWLVRNARRFGFRPYYYEPWHWEYVGQ